MSNSVAADRSLVAALSAEPSAHDEASAEVLALFELYGPALLRFCGSVLRSSGDAEDVLQETFLKLLRHLQAGGSRSNLRSWLFTVAANDCRSRMRSRQRWIPWLAETDSRSVAPADERPGSSSAIGALRALAARDRLLLSLRAQGLSYREIGAAAGIREQSVGRLLARAVARWKQKVRSGG